MQDRRWFIFDKDQINYINEFLQTVNNDGGPDHYIVCTTKDRNVYTKVKDYTIREVSDNDIFRSKEKAQHEIMRRERFPDD